MAKNNAQAVQQNDVAQEAPQKNETGKKSLGAYAVAGAALVGVVALWALPLAGAVYGAAVGIPYLIGGGVASGLSGALVGMGWGMVVQQSAVGVIKVAQSVKKDGFLKTLAKPVVAAGKLVKSLRTVGLRATLKKIGATIEAKQEASKAAEAARKAERAAKKAAWNAEYEARQAEKAAKKQGASLKQGFEAAANNNDASAKPPVAAPAAAPKAPAQKGPAA